jgi:hypothetical protein
MVVLLYLSDETESKSLGSNEEPAVPGVVSLTVKLKAPDSFASKLYKLLRLSDNSQETNVLPRRILRTR